MLLPSSAGGCSLAVHVRHSSSGSSWEVLLLPAVQVANHLSAPVHVCLSREVSSLASMGGSAHSRVQQQHQVLEIGSGGSANAQLHGGGTLLRLWLGGDISSGGGWSQAISLPQYHNQPQHEPLLMVLHCSPAASASAMGAGVRAPAAPGAAKQQLGALLAQLLPPDAATGQASIRIWPPLLLRNALPCPVRLLLPVAGAAGAGAAAAELQPAAPAQHAVGQQPSQQELVLPPGASHQLTVPLHGGTVGALLAVEATPAGAGSAAASYGNASSSGSRPGVAVVVPPLIAESAEQQWFGSAGIKAAASGAVVGGAEAVGPAAAVFIAPPGEATWLRLPLLVCSRATHAGDSSAAAGSTLMSDCLLVTQQHADGLPLLQLTIQPALAVHNCLPVPLLFQVGCICGRRDFQCVCRQGVPWPIQHVSFASQPVPVLLCHSNVPSTSAG